MSGAAVPDFGVVRAERSGPGIVTLRMEDRASRNAFSPALCLGLIEAFKWLETEDDARVAVLVGCDGYFASGGTRSGILSMQAGRSTFSDTNVYSLALDCSIPVIAAMQGHAFGGGFALGLYADFVVLCREAVYATNFMNYGFTPGMGSTHILRAKLGQALASEMLLGAQTFRGATLKERGVPYAVLPRAQFDAHVAALARDVASKPRAALQVLKRHLVADLKAQLPDVVAAELQMHRATIHADEVRDRIDARFGGASQ